MALSTFDAILARVAAGFWASESCLSEQAAAVTSTLFTGQNMPAHLGVNIRAFPTPLPTGVTAYIPTRLLQQTSTNYGFIWARLVNLGNLDLAAPTFTDGSAFPSVTEAGVSRSESGPILAEVTTVLNATPGSITVTYVDQDGNTAEATASHTLTASAAVGTCGFMGLVAGDWSARDITTATRTGGTTPTGVITFWGVRMLCVSCLPAANGELRQENLLTSAFCPQRLAAGDVLNVIGVGAAGIKTGLFEVFAVGDN